MTAAPVSALPDIQIYEGFRISLRNLQTDFRARCCTEQACELIDMLTRVTPSTRPEPTPHPSGDLALSRWGGGASRSTRKLLKFLRKLFAVTEKLELPAARRLPISRDGYFKIFRAEIMAHTGLNKDALTRALSRFEKLGLVSRHHERQENGHQHLWLRFNPDAMFKLLNRLTDFRGMKRATKTLLVKVVEYYNENEKKPEQNQPFLIAPPMRDLAHVSSIGGGVDPCVGGVGGLAVARVGSSTSPGDQPAPPVDQKIPPGGAGEDCFLAEPATPAAPPAPPTPTRAPVAFFAGGSAAEAVIATAMDREVPACTSKPGVKYHQGLEVVGEVNLNPDATRSVIVALPEDCQPIFVQLERLDNFMTHSDEFITDKDIQHLVMWIHHPNPENRMTLSDVSDYVSRRQNNQEPGGFMMNRIWSCNFADFTAFWPVIIRALRREQSENDLVDNLIPLQQIKDLNATADRIVRLAASALMETAVFKQWFPQGVLMLSDDPENPDEPLAYSKVLPALFAGLCRLPATVAEMDCENPSRLSHLSFQECRARRRTFNAARLIVAARRGEQWPELRTPAAIAFQVNMVEALPLVAKVLAHVGCDKVYPLVEHATPGFQSRLASRWSKFIGKLEAVCANDKYRTEDPDDDKCSA